MAIQNKIGLYDLYLWFWAVLNAYSWILLLVVFTFYSAVIVVGCFYILQHRCYFHLTIESNNLVCCLSFGQLVYDYSKC